MSEHKRTNDNKEVFKGKKCPHMRGEEREGLFMFCSFQREFCDCGLCSHYLCYCHQMYG